MILLATYIQVHEKLVEYVMHQLDKGGQQQLLPLIQDSHVEQKRQMLRITESDMQTSQRKLKALGI